MFRIHRNLKRVAGVSIAASLLVLCFAFTANAADTGSVLGDGVRLRSEPSTESEELDVLNQGDTLEILDSTNEDWYQVSYTGDDGEVYTGYVSRDLVSAGVTQTAVITGGPVELKSDAAAEADTLAQIPDGGIAFQDVYKRQTMIWPRFFPEYSQPFMGRTEIKVGFTLYNPGKLL